MCARRFAPNAHASLRICLPAHTARTLYVVTPPDALRSGRLARFTPARGRSITTPSQHVRPALCVERPRFAALLSSCAQGSALLIFFASACQIGVVTLSSIVRPVDNTSSRYADTSAAHFFRHSSLRFCLPARWISASVFAPFATPRCADISPAQRRGALFLRGAQLFRRSTNVIRRGSTASAKHIHTALIQPHQIV